MIIIPEGSRATERELSLALLAFLATCAYGEADFKTIFFNLPNWIRLSSEDRAVARERDAEQKWHGIIRNIAAHADQPGNAIYDGLLVKRRGGGYQLASKVRKTA